jgi:hypothetical protein
MKKTITIISLLTICTFFACKKEETNTPTTVVAKELEISGQVFDFETGKPLEGMPVYLYRFGNKTTLIRQLISASSFENKIAISDVDGRYKYKFTAYDTLSYHVGVHKDGYIQFDGNRKCNNCLELISPFMINNFTSDFTLTHKFNVIKAGRINLRITSSNIPASDSLYYSEHQFYGKTKIDGDSYRLNLANYPNINWELPTLADRMTYFTWKLKSETAWHKDSILTPFGKTVDFEIKY